MLARRRRSRFERRTVGRQVGRIGPALPSHTRGGGGPQPEVVPAPPAGQVVEALPPGTGIVRNLVRFKAGIRQHRRRGVERPHHGVVNGQTHLSAGRLLRQARPRLHPEGVDRHMIRHEGDGLCERVTPVRIVYARQAGDEIQPHVGDAGLPHEGHTRSHVGHAVTPLQGAQHRIIKDLHPETNTVDPGGGQRCQPLRRQGARIGLDGPLPHPAGRQRCEHPEQAAPLFSGEERGRAPSYIEGRTAACDPIGPRRQFALKCIQVAIGAGRAVGFGVEATVAALSTAKRYMYVEMAGSTVHRAILSHAASGYKALSACVKWRGRG